ncbi:hypothetical protein LSM04_005942 [Trypanosoma melophagium]|uniref:uncharacterized protein n=1 Tax=Trypanosoma melophagium TaxID=715481 RepID=UPI00351A5BF9|nr:hypothetical protein LSM04_005942 [Trypanosoma melophagium]
MLLRVRGNGASPENSQAALVFLRGFRLTNTRPPLGEYKSLTGTRPLIYSHFPVGIQVPSATNDADLSAQLHRTVWKEIWNMYDIVYDELCLFPESVVITNLLSSCGNTSSSSSSSGATETEDVANFTRLTARDGSQRAVVVTHYFSEDTLRNQVTGGKFSVIVLDVSFLPLKDAATRIAVEVAWLAAYASMEGALDHVSWVVVRLPYECDFTNTDKTNSPLVQEGLDFIGEHVELLVRSFKQKTQEDGGSSVCVSFIGSNPTALLERLQQIRSLRPSTSGTTVKEEEEGVTVFTGDHHREAQKGQENEKEEEKKEKEAFFHSLASSLGVRVTLDVVPLKSLLEGGEESWDEATTIENQVLNFCPCCGHCGCH